MLPLPSISPQPSTGPSPAASSDEERPSIISRWDSDLTDLSDPSESESEGSSSSSEPLSAYRRRGLKIRIPARPKPRHQSKVAQCALSGSANGPYPRATGGNAASHAACTTVFFNGNGRVYKGGTRASTSRRLRTSLPV